MNQPAWLFGASTLGVVEEDLPTTIDIFGKHHVQAVELRSAAGAFVHPEMSAKDRLRVRGDLEGAGLDIFAVASRVKIAAPGDDERIIDDLAAEIRLAADLGARFVRVFPGAPTAETAADVVPALEEDVESVDARAVLRLVRVMDTAVAHGVRPLIETHDSHPRGQDVARVLERLDEVAPGHVVGAIWDLLHPWRVGESVDQTAGLLLDYLLQDRGYVQVKDVTARASRFPVPQGHGAVPLQQMLGLLDDAGYRGPVSLEWERFWKPDAAPLNEALAAAAQALTEHPPRHH